MARNMCYSDIIVYPERDGVYNNWGPTDNWAGKVLDVVQVYTFSPSLLSNGINTTKTEWADSLFFFFF